MIVLAHLASVIIVTSVVYSLYKKVWRVLKTALIIILLSGIVYTGYQIVEIIKGWIA